MQEWLKDKKNLPIVIAIGSLVFVGSIIAMLFEFGVLGHSTPAPVPVASASSSAPPAAPPSPGVPPGAPGGPPGAPSTPGAAPPNATAKAPGTGTPPAQVGKTDDPFRVPGFPAPVTSLTTAPVATLRTQVPFVYIARIAPRPVTLISPTQGQTPFTQVSATQRVSGVLFTDTGVHAVLETNGQSQQVQPGDPVDGGKVVSIQADGLTLRRDDGTLVRVPLSGTSTGAGT